MLNAFRHPRNFHNLHFDRWDADDLVLNAFRHPRNFHMNVRLLRRVQKQCSTPFGILGIFTPAIRSIVIVPRSGGSDITSWLGWGPVVPAQTICKLSPEAWQSPD